MKIKYFFIKEEVQTQRVEDSTTNLMIANPLTKGFSPKTFNEHDERTKIIEHHS